MANRTATNPIYIDQFNADVTIAAEGIPITVTKIIVLSVADGDVFSLDDARGNVVVRWTQTGGGDTFEIDFGSGFTFSNGLVLDVSDCTGMVATDGTDAMWVYQA